MIIDCSLIKLGIKFSAPVYFEDGKNMFLGANRPVKPFHMLALKRWPIPFLVTDGTIIDSTGPEKNLNAEGSDEEEIEELESIDDFDEAGGMGVV